MTVEELIAKLEALPPYRLVEVDPANGSLPTLLVEVAERTTSIGARVVLR